MKKRILLLSIGACMFVSQVMAGTITLQTAQVVATNFYKGNQPTVGTVTPTLVYTRTEADQTVDYYVFNMLPTRGFVAVAADDAIQPVIAYSTQSDFNTNFEKTGVKDWADHTAAHIYSSIQQRLAADARISHLWAAYISGPYAPASRASHIGPLLRSTWNQSPWYNAMCPYDSIDQERTVTGCVATTMAQVMRYWSYPTRGTGAHSYDCWSSTSHHYGTLSTSFNHTYPWANMTYNLGGNDSAIARLMYDCGVSVEMGYGDNTAGGSGAFVLQDEVWGGGSCAENSYVSYFKYDPSTIQGVHQRSYTSSQWFALMKKEVDAGRVVQYEGYDPSQGGHTWVLDGYDVNGLVHMNWGWGGMYDGYFAVTSLVAGGANFGTNEAALIGIQPLYPYDVNVQASTTQVCLGTSAQLTTQGPAGATYSWYPATGLACATCASTAAHPTTSTVYTLTTDSAGVKVLTSVLLNVVPAVSAGFIGPVSELCSTPAVIRFKNTSQYASNYHWDFGDGATSTDSAATHSYATYGTYTVRLRVSGMCGTDSVVGTQSVVVSDYAPSVTGQTVCSGSSANLTASSAVGNLLWYTSASGGTPVGFNTAFSTPALTASATYYVATQVLGDLIGAGPLDKTFGAGSYYTGSTAHSEIFACTVPQILSYIDVEAQNDGNVTVTLATSSGVVLQTGTYAVTAGLNTIALGFNIPVGNNLKLTATGSPVQLYRNNAGTHYPYYSQDSAVVITGSDAGTGYYFFFYNWQLQSAACVSNRIPVVATVLSGAPSFSYSSAAGNVVAFTTPASGATYVWDFGDGSTSADQNPTHTYSTGGTYSVSLTVSNGSCSATAAGSISAAQGATAIHDLDIVQGISTYPNPVMNQLEVRINAAQAATVSMIIYDMIGHVVATDDVKIDIGTNTRTQDVSSYASGVYMIVMNDGHSKSTSRFVKQ